FCMKRILIIGAARSSSAEETAGGRGCKRIPEGCERTGAACEKRKGTVRTESAKSGRSCSTEERWADRSCCSTEKNGGDEVVGGHGLGLMLDGRGGGGVLAKVSTERRLRGKASDKCRGRFPGQLTGALGARLAAQLRMSVSLVALL